ncbi:MAG: hypothetical protein SFV22_03420 [Saprospiraceae bacterium]|nr:hypothetical protein [Saprospiraceae bacterium]
MAYNQKEIEKTQRSACPAFKAYFRLGSDKRLRVFFLKRQIPPALVKEHFGNGHFEMPTAFDLPGELLRYLGVEQYRIHPGKYPVSEDPDFIRVDF